jgi:hypothetical protein
VRETERPGGIWRVNITSKHEATGAYSGWVGVGGGVRFQAIEGVPTGSHVRGEGLGVGPQLRKGCFQSNVW